MLILVYVIANNVNTLIRASELEKIREKNQRDLHRTRSVGQVISKLCFDNDDERRSSFQRGFRCDETSESGSLLPSIHPRLSTAETNLGVSMRQKNSPIHFGTEDDG